MICPNCKADNLFEDARFCPSCGAQLSSPPNEHKSPEMNQTESGDDDLDFVVTETADTGGPELVGADQKPVAQGIPRDDIDIKGPADLLGNEPGEQRPADKDELDFSGMNPDTPQSNGETAASPENETAPQFVGKSESAIPDDDDELITQENYIPPAVEEPVVAEKPDETDFGELRQESEPAEETQPVTESHPETMEPPREEQPEKPAKPDIPAWEEPVIPQRREQPSEPPKPDYSTQQFSAPRSELHHASEPNQSGSDRPMRAFPGSEPEPEPPQETISQAEKPQEPAAPAPEPPQNIEPQETQPSEPVNKITPIADPSLKNKPEVKKATRMRGLANYKGNYIRLVGNAYLHENDELNVGGKAYVLKPFQFGKKFKIYGIAAGFVLALLIVGSFFINPIVGSDGKIVGMALNEYSQPFVAGAKVTIKELGESTTTSPQGFFEFEMIPTGTYEFIFESNGKIVGRGNATVVAGQTTMMTFGNLSQNYANQAGSDPVSYVPEEETAPPPQSKETERTASKKKSADRNSGSGFGKIKLAANVDGAKFVVDGKTLGAGNNTYTRIKPGKHKVNISLDGYTDHTEIVSVSSGKTVTVRANLSPRADQKQTLTASDYLTSGNSAYATGDYNKAIEDFTKTIDLDPSSVSAYGNRARAFAQLGKYADAASDYIRAGEIYRFHGSPDEAIRQFSNALDMNGNNKLAYVGRAGARMDKSEYRAAKLDYDEALDIDGKFYPALFGAGICEYQLGKNKNADKYFRKAKDVNESDPYLYHFMMLNYAARDDESKVRRTYDEFKQIASAQELAEFKSSSQYEPVLRMIKKEDL